jgi:hypothetical protein
MENEIETLDSPNEAEPETESEGEGKEEEPQYSDRERKLFARTKKSEGEIKVLKDQLKKYEQKPESDKSQSNEPDYAKIAFLEQRGISHPDDQKIVQDEAARLKLPLTDILAMAHIKSKLETLKDQRESMDGQKGLGRGKGSGNTKGDVDYWLAKGETPDDQELAQKVIAARIKKETDGNKFSNDLYTG